MELLGSVIKIEDLTDEDIYKMYLLMAEFYDNALYENFCQDLKEKNFCIMLYGENRSIKGFSTQKVMAVNVHGKPVWGLFSGDTIIHQNYWGSMELYKIFAGMIIEYSSKYKDFYWFLLSKGYKTYKMMPLFFKEFYPNYQKVTPDYEKEIINAFGQKKFLNEFNRATGVVEYKGIKDRLKDGVADITNKQLKDKNIIHFMKLNPGYIKGNDLVCICKLCEENMKPLTKRLLLGTDKK